MTAKARREKNGRSEAKASKDTGNVVDVVIPATGTAKEAEATLAATILGWSELTEEQKAELTDLALAQQGSNLPVKVKVRTNPEGGRIIDIEGPCETYGIMKLHKTFAAVSMDPVNARASELLKYLGSVGADTSPRYNAALSFIESMEPQNQAEALLLVQMYCTHDAAIRALSQLGSADWVPTVQTFGNLATKLLRASQGQMETLSRMRRGGEQIVRHIHVDNRGGQAVIAENVHSGGQQNAKSDDQSHATGSAGVVAEMLGSDPFGSGVPVPGREGAEAVPDARWDQSGRS